MTPEQAKKLRPGAIVTCRMTVVSVEHDGCIEAIVPSRIRAAAPPEMFTLVQDAPLRVGDVVEVLTGYNSKDIATILAIHGSEAWIDFNMHSINCGGGRTQRLSNLRLVTDA